MSEALAKAFIWSDPGKNLLASFKIVRLSASVQFVLELVFYVLFEILGDVISMRDVTYSSKGDCDSELVGERREICLDGPANEWIILSLQFIV
jgi:hypothetical protein